MSSLSVRKPRPTNEREHFLQLKQSLCHWRSSKEIYLVPPSPEKAKDVVKINDKAVIFNSFHLTALSQTPAVDYPDVDNSLHINVPWQSSSKWFNCRTVV